MALFKTSIQSARDREAAAQREHAQAIQRYQEAMPEIMKSDDLDTAAEPYQAEIEQWARRVKLRGDIRAAAEREEAERHASALEKEDRARRKATVQYAANIVKHSEKLSQLLSDARDEWRRINTQRERLIAIMPRAWYSDYGDLALARFQMLFLIETWRLGEEPGGPNPLTKRPVGLMMYELAGDGRIPSLAENLQPVLDGVKRRIGAAPAGDLVADLKPKPVKPEIVSTVDLPPAVNSGAPVMLDGGSPHPAVEHGAAAPPVVGALIDLRGGRQEISDLTERTTHGDIPTAPEGDTQPATEPTAAPVAEAKEDIAGIETPSPQPARRVQRAITRKATAS